jgi:hypothetical protein
MAKIIKKAQYGTTVKDKTAVFKPKRKPDVVAEKSNYHFLKGSEKGKAPTKKDSTNYDRGYNIGRKNKKSLFMASDMNTYMGSVEGSIDKNKPKKKLKSGGSLSGLKASNKRVGPVDPKGAFTKVQKKTLAGAKGKAKLTADKQLGATKMAKRGMSIKKK